MSETHHAQCHISYAADMVLFALAGLETYNLSRLNLDNQRSLDFLKHFTRLLFAYNQSADHILDHDPRHLAVDLTVLKCGFAIAQSVLKIPNFLLRRAIVHHHTFRYLSTRLAYFYCTAAMRSTADLRTMMEHIPEDEVYRLRQDIKAHIICSATYLFKELRLILRAFRLGEHENITLQRLDYMAFKIEEQSKRHRQLSAAYEEAQDTSMADPPVLQVPRQRAAVHVGAPPSPISISDEDDPGLEEDNESDGSTHSEAGL